MAAPRNGEPRAHAVRLATSAGDEIQNEHSRLAAVSGFENRLFPDGIVRQLLYRRERGPTWRILFTLHEAAENGPPTVRVYHVRHGAQAPMTEWPAEDE